LSLKQDGFDFTESSVPPVTSLGVTAINWNDLGKKFTLASSVRYKQTVQDEVPYYVQEALGYDNFVRGYEFFVIDGQDFILFKENLHFPLIQPFETQIEQIPFKPFQTFYFAAYLNAFVDAGYVWDSQYAAQNFLDNKWLLGYGLGLDIVGSYDRILRLEYSFNNLNESGLFLHFRQPF